MMFSIIRKELRSYFVTMTAYVYLGAFVLLTGLFFIGINIDGGNASFGQTLLNTQLLFILLIPTLTMRLFAEEARQRTDQLLLTSPLKISDIVLGKFVAATFIFMLSLLLLLAFPYILSFAPGIEVSVREISVMILGYFLLGTCFISVGIFISTLTNDQIVAAVVTCAALLLFVLMSMIALSMPTTRLASGIFIGAIIAAFGFYIYISAKNYWASIIFCLVTGGAAVAVRFINPNLYDGLIYHFFMWFNLFERFFAFAHGVIRLSDVIYFLSFMSVFIYLTIHVIERRRWK
jgi:ABC-2 type transport system permease protein